jgi:hypothetical protein
MSAIGKGELIACDGPGCLATARAPIALRPTLGKGSREQPEPIGWLYVIKDGSELHYCPDCAATALAERSPFPRR